MLRSILVGSSIFALLFASSLPTRAQDEAPTQEQSIQEQPEEEAGEVSEISQEELKQFVETIKLIQVIEEQAKVEMLKTLETLGLNPQDYQAFLQGQQNPEEESTPQVTEEQQQIFEQARDQIAEIQKTAQLKMQEAVENEGIGIESFSRISTAVQKDPDLQEQVKLLLQS
ncbi:MAG: DUF4168 domain-containing protein [Symploca sp. SIO1C4]|uniref:DUF4168 domain-containing protein n=1 Tax=Symploca sp. SIO1C4 TaxID=2607765 RepID=A0A6B3NS38_9CYAN|nr:DUF4168 domain-containing protein [Symploca sp. SIO1C4]